IASANACTPSREFPPPPFPPLSRSVRLEKRVQIRLRRENLAAFGQHDPGLLAARPKMRCGLQPRGVVERAASNPPDHHAPPCTGLRAADHPAAAFRAQPSCDRPAAVRDLLRQPRLTLRH